VGVRVGEAVGMSVGAGDGWGVGAATLVNVYEVEVEPLTEALSVMTPVAMSTDETVTPAETPVPETLSPAAMDMMPEGTKSSVTEVPLLTIVESLKDTTPVETSTAVTVVPSTTPVPDTMLPTMMEAAVVVATVTVGVASVVDTRSAVVVPIVVPEFLKRMATLLASLVAAALNVTVESVTATTVVPEGMLAPTTTVPTVTLFHHW